MALGDIFKKKNVKKKTEKIEKKETKELKKKVSKADLKISEKKTKKIGGENAWKVLKSSHITEKAAFLTQENRYVFKVFSKANKIEIKKAVEKLYKVKVLSVNIIKVPRKRRRLGKTFGWKKGFKKAIVQIKEGQKIEELTI
jgi:large subunit ribosomal protein L23